MPLPINPYARLSGPNGDPEDFDSIEGEGPVPDQAIPSHEAIDPNSVPAFAGLAGSSAANQSDTEGTNLYEAGLAHAAPYIPVQQNSGLQPDVMGDYSNYRRPFGEEGKSGWDSVVGHQNAAAEHYNEVANYQDQESKKLERHYEVEKLRQDERQAVMEQDRQYRQQDYQVKQMEMDNAVKKYSADLSDTGKFWRNPGHILSAIGAAFISGGSPGDPGIGVRMIENAVNADFAQRKAAADMHLGELRSNLSGYRQLMGDKELGDRYAYQQSILTAANEVQRIGAQFAGPIAREKAMAISEDMKRNAELQMGQIHAALIYNQAHIENPLIKRSVENTNKYLPNTGGYFAPNGGVNPKGQKLGTGTTAPNNPPAAFLAKEMGDTTKYDRTYSGGNSGPANDTSTPAPMKSGYSAMTEARKSEFEKRYPGAAQQLDTERFANQRDIFAHVGGPIQNLRPGMSDAEVSKLLTPKQQLAYNKEMRAFHNWMAEDYKEVAQRAAPIAKKLAGTREMETDAEIMEQVAHRMGTTPDELLNSRNKQIFGSGNVKTIQEYLDASEPKGKHEEEARNIANFVRRFEMLKQSQFNAFIKELSGSAVSEPEQKRIDQFYKTDHSFAATREFIRNLSRDAQADAQNATAGAKSSTVSTLWKIRMGQTPTGVSVSPVKGASQTKDESPNMSTEVQSRKDSGRYTGGNSGSGSREDILKRAAGALGKRSSAEDILSR